MNCALCGAGGTCRRLSMSGAEDDSFFTTNPFSKFAEDERGAATGLLYSKIAESCAEYSRFKSVSLCHDPPRHLLAP